MRVDDAGGGVKAGIGDAPHADAAVVAADVLDQPVDGVVGVASSRRRPAGRAYSAICGRMLTNSPSDI